MERDTARKMGKRERTIYRRRGAGNEEKEEVMDRATDRKNGRAGNTGGCKADEGSEIEGIGANGVLGWKVK